MRRRHANVRARRALECASRCGWPHQNLRPPAQGSFCVCLLRANVCFPLQLNAAEAAQREALQIVAELRAAVSELEKERALANVAHAEVAEELKNERARFEDHMRSCRLQSHEQDSKGMTTRPGIGDVEAKVLCSSSTFVHTLCRLISARW